MGVKVTTVVLILFVAVFSIAIVAAMTHAQEAPALPMFFYGKANYNNKDVPVGATVIAKINNATKGSIKVQQPGIYGFQDTDQKLAVSGSRNDIGQKIEFYVKIPKLKEIKATQTASWRSNNITQLDLTFVGQEIIDNSTEQINNKTRETIVFNSITAGKPVVAFITNQDLPVIRLQLVTLTNLTNVTIDFEIVDELPSSVTKLDGTYKYLWISAPKLKQADIKTAILRFRVSNEWFELFGYEPATVKLYRYNNNRWNELETFHEGTDQFDSYYRSSTPGFSYFAIRASTSGAKQTINQTVTQKTEEETTKKTEENPTAASVPEEKKSAGETVNQITGYAVEKVKSNPIIGFMLLLIGIFIGILATYFFVVGKKEEQQ